MKCPYCKNEMKRGYIHCHNGFYALKWKEFESDLSIKIEPWYSNFTKTKLDNVFYCKKCSIIIRKMDKK